MNSPQDFKAFLSALGVPPPFHAEIVKAASLSVFCAILDSAVREAWMTNVVQEEEKLSTSPGLDYPAPGSSSPPQVETARKSKTHLKLVK